MRRPTQVPPWETAIASGSAADCNSRCAPSSCPPHVSIRPAARWPLRACPAPRPGQPRKSLAEPLAGRVAWERECDETLPRREVWAEAGEALALLLDALAIVRPQPFL